jgi:hypothetical protein
MGANLLSIIDRAKEFSWVFRVGKKPLSKYGHEKDRAHKQLATIGDKPTIIYAIKTVI